MKRRVIGMSNVCVFYEVGRVKKACSPEANSEENVIQIGWSTSIFTLPIKNLFHPDPNNFFKGNEPDCHVQ